MKGLRVLAITAGVLGIGATPSLSQSTAQDTVMTTPSGRYDAGAVHRFFLGDLNRTLWSSPVNAVTLDLGGYAGGLIPVRRGGGLQTQSLRLRGADGQLYNFRSIDKDATRTLDPVLRDALPARVLQDQIGALFPLSAMVVAPLLEAADVLHPDPTLVVMPDDPRLGEFREEFAGLLGWIEVRPDEGPDGEPGFAGSSRVTGSDRLLERLEESPNHQVDTESFLRARLTDVFVGDWDRHPDQWRWAGFDEGNVTRWEPIPRDRDWALSRLNGILVYAAGRYFVHYRGFGTDYEPVLNATFTGRALDRRLLQSLGREDFLRVARDLQSRLTDEVIADAVGRLPASYQERIGEWLETALLNRRDDLDEFAAEYYELLAGWVDVYGTDDEDLALIEHLDDRQLRLRMYELDDNEPDGPPYFDRTFTSDETKELRVFLQGDDDQTVVKGTSDSGIIVRVVGGGSDDIYTDSTTAGAWFYDHRGDNEFAPGSSTHVDEHDWEEPPDQWSATHQSKARDWGSWALTYPVISFNSDVGPYAGLAVRRDAYGFRHYPYKSRITVQGSLGPAVGRARGSVTMDLPGPLRQTRTKLSVFGSSKEFARFFGFGNDTEVTASDNFFRFTRDQVRVDLLLAEPDSERVRLAIGPTFQFMDHDDETARKFIGTEAPYGLGRFAQLGLMGSVAVDYRDHAVVPRNGWIVETTGRYFPSMLDVETAFAGVRGTARWYASGEDVPLDPLFAVRVGGEKLWGTVPYHQSAFLGGPTSVFGFREHRFAGDASLFGNAMLSVNLTDFYFLLPGELGLLGLAEAGRVYLDGDSPGGWHGAYGGGLWLSFVNPHTLMSITVSRSDERTGFSLALGWPF